MVEIENLKKEILDLLTPYLAEPERAGKIYIENEEYKESSKTADLIFEELNETLTDEQQELLERYFIANNATVALTERLVYQQGMRGFLNLFISLLKDSGFPKYSENPL